METFETPQDGVGYFRDMVVHGFKHVIEFIRKHRKSLFNLIGTRFLFA